MPSVTPSLTERQWQAQVLNLANLGDWRVFHPLTAQKKGAWATFQSGHKGYPDLTLVKPSEGILFVELKTERGKLSDDQIEWRDRIRAAGGEWHLWRPSDIEYVTRRLLKGSG